VKIAVLTRLSDFRIVPADMDYAADIFAYNVKVLVIRGFPWRTIYQPSASNDHGIKHYNHDSPRV